LNPTCATWNGMLKGQQGASNHDPVHQLVTGAMRYRIAIAHQNSFADCHQVYDKT